MSGSTVAYSVLNRYEESHGCVKILDMLAKPVSELFGGRHVCAASQICSEEKGAVFKVLRVVTLVVLIPFTLISLLCLAIKCAVCGCLKERTTISGLLDISGKSIKQVSDLFRKVVDAGLFDNARDIYERGKEVFNLEFLSAEVSGFDEPVDTVLSADLQKKKFAIERAYVKDDIEMVQLLYQGHFFGKEIVGKAALAELYYRIISQHSKLTPSEEYRNLVIGALYEFPPEERAEKLHEHLVEWIDLFAEGDMIATDLSYFSEKVTACYENEDIVHVKKFIEYFIDHLNLDLLDSRVLISLCLINRLVLDVEVEKGGLKDTVKDFDRLVQKKKEFYEGHPKFVKFKKGNCLRDEDVFTQAAFKALEDNMNEQRIVCRVLKGVSIDFGVDQLDQVDSFVCQVEGVMDALKIAYTESIPGKAMVKWPVAYSRLVGIIESYKSGKRYETVEEFEDKRDEVNRYLTDFTSKEFVKAKFLDQLSMQLTLSKIRMRVDREKVDRASSGAKSVDPQVLEDFGLAYVNLRNAQVMAIYEKYFLNQEVECEDLDDIKNQLVQILKEESPARDKFPLFVEGYRSMDVDKRIEQLKDDLINKMRALEIDLKDKDEVSAYATFVRDVMFDESSKKSLSNSMRLIGDMYIDETFLRILAEFDKESVFVDALFATLFEGIDLAALAVDSGLPSLEGFKLQVTAFQTR